MQDTARSLAIECDLLPPAPTAPASRTRRPLILHITGDYPDPVRNRTTYAVKNFIDKLDGCDHLIVSIRRYTNPAGCYLRAFDESPGRKLFALGYWALPGGFFHRNAMRRVARQVREIIARSGARPDLVVAHKLTIEGVVAYRLWKKLQLPYACCVRGEVEDKFFRYKRGLRALFGRVVKHSEALIYVSAWFKPRIERAYPGMARRQMLLPNFSDHAAAELPESPPDARTFVTVLDLGMYRRKGFDDLILALALARKRVPDLKLDVIGWSTPSAMRRVRNLVRQAGVEDAVRFLGFKPHHEVLKALPHYGAMVLPARNETFGMVYVESLFCQTPILYGRGSGIDGYLGGLEPGVAVEVGNVKSIADGLCRLAQEGPQYRRNLRRDYRSICARFAPEAYLRDFGKLVETVRSRDARAKGFG